MSETTPEPAAPRAEPSNADIAGMLALIVRRMDQQTASFAALAGILATTPGAADCDTRLAMGAAGMMIPKLSGNESMRKAAAANVVAILGMRRALDTISKGLVARP